MSYNPFPIPADVIVISAGSSVTSENRFPVGIGTTGSVSLSQGGSLVTFNNPLPVSLGSSSITITGDVNVGTVVSVTSSPETPVHVHLTEVGTTDILNVPYIPIGIGTTNQNLSYLPVGISTLKNTVSVSNTSFYVTGLGSSVSVANTAFYIKNENSIVSPANPLPIALPTTQIDAFNRIRVSNPLTLFDSSHRYRDNNLWTSLIVGASSTVGFATYQGLMNLVVGTGATDSIIRETTKVFAYEPGKSLEILNTCAMNTPQNHLTQRYGYYGTNNGIYFESAGTTLNFVERSNVSGITTESRIPQSQWLYDKLDGTGPSGYILDASKAQILWMDIEWLGVGTVRVGFVIDGRFIHCHSFHHANKLAATYITTASLPIRYEIFNTGISTTGISTMKQVCSSVISEGGYELRGFQQAVSTPITSPVGLTTAGTYYNLISLRLKTSPDRTDAIVIPTAVSLLGGTNNANYNWQIRSNGVSIGGTWISAGTDSSVEYKIDGSTYSGGRILASVFFNASQQGSTPVDIVKEALFKFQLERDGLTKTPYELSLICATDTTTSTVYASMDWEEVSR